VSYRKRQALGADWGKVASALEVGKNVLDDPYLPQFTCEVLRLAKVERGQAPGAPCRTTVGLSTAAVKRGIGLRFAVTPLKIWIYQRQHPWLLPTVVAGVLGLTFLVGYKAGKRRKAA
jgi:hypothetical protein